jgi:riboflavin biosynthesis pyrimidine reductase
LLPAPGADEVDLDDSFWVHDVDHQQVRGVMVASADGAAQAHGRAAGLSGPADTDLFAALRGQADVILAGATTARVEGYAGERPSAARRDWRRARGLSDAPPIAVVTGTCQLDPSSGLFTETVAKPIVITHRRAPEHRVAALAEVADIIRAGEYEVDLAGALDALAGRGLRRVSCEGGPRLLSQVAAADRLDELLLTISPLLVGGSALRVLDGPLLDPPTRLRLTLVLEDDSFLFLRYLRPGATVA